MTVPGDGLAVYPHGAEPRVGTFRWRMDGRTTWRLCVFRGDYWDTLILVKRQPDRSPLHPRGWLLVNMAIQSLAVCLEASLACRVESEPERFGSLEEVRRALRLWVRGRRSRSRALDSRTLQERSAVIR